MMSPWFIFLVYLMVFFAPFGVLFVDREYTRQFRFDRAIEEKKEIARKQLGNTKFSCSWEFQLKSALTRFHDESEKFIGSADSEQSIRELYEKVVLPLNLPHELILKEKEADKPFKTIFRGGEKSFFSEKFQLFFEKSLETDYKLDPFDFSSFAETCAQPFSFPLFPEIFSYQQTTLASKKEGGFLCFSTVTGVRGIFWYYPDSKDLRVLLAVIFDLANIDEHKGMAILTKEFSNPGIGVAFLPKYAGGKTFASEFFSTRPNLLRKIKKIIRKSPGIDLSGTVNQDFFCVAPALFGMPYYAISAVALPGEIPPGAEDSIFLFLAMSSMALGTLVIGRKLFFGEGPRFSVGFSILIVFCIVAFIPLNGGKIIARKALRDHNENARQEAGAILKREIDRLDNTFFFHGADFLYHIKKLGQIAEVSNFLKGPLEEINKDRLMQVIIDNILPKYPFAIRPGLKIAAVAGPEGFKAGAIEAETEVLTPEKKEKGGSMASDLFAPFLRKFLHRMDPVVFREKSTGALNEKIKMGQIKDEYRDDFSFSVADGLLGPDATYKFLSDPDSMVVGKTYQTALNLTTSPLPVNGKDHFLSVFSWSNVHSEVELLKKYIQESCFRTHPGVKLFGFRKIDFKSDLQKPPGVEISPVLWRLVDRTRRTEIAQASHELETSDAILMEAVPGKSYASFILAGIISLKDIFEEQKINERRLSFFIFGSFFASLLIGYLVFLHFISPLRQLNEGIKAIDRQNFDVRLDENRGDEFGNLARAFNVMAKGLKEGSLLGKYVSSVVMSVLKNKKAFQKALAGENREMTIVFSSLHGFDEFRAGNSPQEIFSILGKHLEGCSSGVKKFGGEIDKVIGDKVMMFFDHDRLGGGKEALEAVINVVGEIRQVLADSPLHATIGINSGSVIAGILGSKDVHLDYTVIGDAVNLAARLNAMAHEVHGSHVVISGNCLEFLDRNVKLEKLSKTKVKGKQQEIEAFLLLTNT